MKRKICTILVVMTALLCSCSAADNSIKATAEQAMSDKYGDVFTAKEVQKIDSESYYVWVIPQSIPSAVVKTAVREDGSGLMDDYIAKKLLHETADTVEAYLKDCQGEYYVHADNSQEYSHADSPNITASEYVREHPGDCFMVSIIAKDTSYLTDSDLQQIARKLNLSKGYIDVFEVNERTLKQIKKNIGRYDNMSSSDVKYALDDSGGVKKSLDLSTVY